MAKSVTEQALQEIIELRIALEHVVFKRLLEVISDEEIAYLRKIVQRITVFVENDMREDTMEEVDHFYSFVYEKTHKSSAEVLESIMEAIEQRDMESLLRHVERRRIEAD